MISRERACTQKKTVTEVTVVWWSDGTVTRNRCPENVTYNPDTGLLFCITKRLLGNNDVAEIFNAWSLPENKEANNAYVTLKDVRKTLRYHHLLLHKNIFLETIL